MVKRSSGGRSVTDGDRSRWERGTRDERRRSAPRRERRQHTPPSAPEIQSRPGPRACFSTPLVSSAYQKADRNLLNICIAHKTAGGAINNIYLFFFFSRTDEKAFSVECPETVSNFLNRDIDV